MITAGKCEKSTTLRSLICAFVFETEFEIAFEVEVVFAGKSKGLKFYFERILGPVSFAVVNLKPDKIRIRARAGVFDQSQRDGRVGITFNLKFI